MSKIHHAFELQMIPVAARPNAMKDKITSFSRRAMSSTWQPGSDIRPAGRATRGIGRRRPP